MYDPSQFRISLWPSGRVPTPTVTGWDLEVRGEVLFFGMPATFDVSVPEEYLLRDLFTIDLTDLGSLADFSARFGPISGLGDTRDVLALLPRYETQTFAGIQGGGIAQVLEGQRAEANLGRDSDYAVPAWLVAQHLRVLRSLILHWEAHREGSGAGLLSAWTGEGFTEPKNNYDAWRRFEDHLNSALRPYHAHMEIAVLNSLPDEFGPLGYKPPDEFGLLGYKPKPPVYSVLALQMWNLVVEDLPIKRCGNETCGQRFLRQEGRARYGQSRLSGVMYCSKSCARAQANRVYRRRRRQREDQF